MDIVNVNIFIIYDCREINHFYTEYIRSRFGRGRYIYTQQCASVWKKKEKMNYYLLWLRGITVNLVPPKPDHHCLPTGETVNTLADIWGRLVCSESGVEVEAQMNLSDKCSWSMCCRLCFGEGPGLGFESDWSQAKHARSLIAQFKTKVPGSLSFEMQRRAIA